MTSISVVIPCYPPHQKHIPSVLSQLGSQSVVPHEIIISLSEISPIEEQRIKNQWIELTSIPLKTISTPSRALAAVNRNMGAMLADGEYIVFLDADDSYSPKLIETVQKTIEIYDPMGILWHLPSESVPPTFISSAELYENLQLGGDLGQDQYYVVQPNLTLDQRIHHGHICVKRKIWEECPQQDCILREDSMYIRLLLQKWDSEGRQGSGLVVIPDILSDYSPNTDMTSKKL